MGIAAYNRGSASIARAFAESYPKRPVEFEIMDHLNALPKYADGGRPFSTIRFESGNAGVWAVCPVSGFGFWYKTLHEAVRRWKVDIVGFDCGVWIAEPRRKS